MSVLFLQLRKNRAKLNNVIPCLARRYHCTFCNTHISVFSPSLVLHTGTEYLLLFHKLALYNYDYSHSQCMRADRQTDRQTAGPRCRLISVLECSTGGCSDDEAFHHTLIQVSEGFWLGHSSHVIHCKAKAEVLKLLQKNILNFVTLLPWLLFSVSLKLFFFLLLLVVYMNCFVVVALWVKA